jgi:hypothetical protein
MTYGSEFFSRHSFALSEPDHIKRNRLKKHDRRFSLPARQQSTADADRGRQDPHASFVATSARSTAESVQLSRMPQSSLITLYEKRTQQLRNVMEMLRNHKVIAADPFDYPVQSIDSMNEEMNILDIEIAASMKRQNTASKWRMSAVFTRKKANAEPVATG